MDNLVLKGLTEVEGMRFHDIEGGFGEGKKSMLVKDIALIHDRDLKDINRLINNNIKRFKNNVDIIDLKVGDFKSLTLEMGYTNQSYANANNIYILSERGYAKLLKILEDDKAWEQYSWSQMKYFSYLNRLKISSNREEIMSDGVKNLSGKDTKKFLVSKNILFTIYLAESPLL